MWTGREEKERRTRREGEGIAAVEEWEAECTYPATFPGVCIAFFRFSCNRSS